MPRTYKRKPGSNQYLTGYTKEELERAINDVTSGKKSYRKAAKDNNVPYPTLFKKVKGKDTVQKKHGGQTRLSQETENLIVQMIASLTNWRVPLDSLDIRCMVKGYLDKKKITDLKILKILKIFLISTSNK